LNIDKKGIIVDGTLYFFEQPLDGWNVVVITRAIHRCNDTIHNFCYLGSGDFGEAFTTTLVDECAGDKPSLFSGGLNSVQTRLPSKELLERLEGGIN
jgi:hypothetical protein